jgi:hypothetical protein
LAPGNETTKTLAITVALPTGATWIEANGLDGTTNFRFPAFGRVAQTEIVGFMDVSAVSTAAALYSSCTITYSGGAPSSEGFATLNIAEVPLADFVSSEPAEPFLEQASCLSPNPIVDGLVSGSTSSTPRGSRRLWWLLDKYRNGFHRHMPFIGVESTDNTAAATNPHWYREANASYGYLDWQYNGNGLFYGYRSYTIARNLYGVGVGATAQTWQVHIRYKTSTTTGANLGLYLEPALAPTTRQVVALPQTNNVWTWLTTTVTAPLTATSGEVYFYFDAQITTGVLQIANITFLDNES